MDWDLLRYFRAVAVERQLGAAGRATGTSAATVSRKISELENLLGGPLLVRDGRGYRLSEFGRDVARRLEAPAESLEDALEDLRSTGKRRRQIVRLNTIESLATFWLPGQMNAILGDDPDLDLDIRSDFSLVDPRSGEADIVLRLGTRGSAPLVGRIVGALGYGLFMAPGQRRMVRFVGAMADTPVGHWTQSTFDFRHKPVIACDSIASAVNILASVGGLAVLPAFIARGRGWVQLEPDRTLHTDIVILRNRASDSNDPPSRVYRRLLGLLKSYDFVSPIRLPSKLRIFKRNGRSKISSL